MDGLTTHAPMTDRLRERGAFDRHPFVLVDVGCSGGIEAAWRVFGPSLVAHGYDPDVAACEEAQAREPFADVRYHAAFVGLPETHPSVQQRAAEAERWPNTNIWGRITAGALAQRAQEQEQEQEPAPAGEPRPMADPGAVLGVDEIVRSERLETVDFLKVDVDGRDVDVLESAREVLAEKRVLGVGMEANWFGSGNPTEHSFHVTDRFLREQGFTLFGLTVRRYSRTDLPAPFQAEAYARTTFGQPYQGDAIYLRDLAAPHLAELAADYPPEKLIKLACLYELVGLVDCAAEVLNRFEARLKRFGRLEPLRDALTPPLLGEQLTYREYLARFESAPHLFLPSAAGQPGQPPPPPPPRAPAAARSPKISARKVLGRVKRPDASPAELAARWRSSFLERAPAPVIRSVAGALARGRPLALDPDWRFRWPADDEAQLTLLKRDIWSYYRDHAIDSPVVFRWYDGLRVRLFLGNDLSQSLFVLGSFEPNEFVFLRHVLEPGMVMLDGGANDGLYSLYAARRVGPQGLVLAVEPSAREFARLKANIELNRLENVKPFKLALGSRVGDAHLAVAEARHAGMNTLDPAVAPASPDVWGDTKESVALETIDALVARCGVQRLDVVKLDVEGSEVDALEGAYSAIARFRPTILLEAEDARLATQGRSKDDLVRAMAELDYELWAFDAGSMQLRPAEPPSAVEGNVVAAPRGWRPPAMS
jgi:FkbM family methyltransferase